MFSMQHYDIIKCCNAFFINAREGVGSHVANKLNGDPTLYARSFRRRFFAYHHAVNHLHTNIILSSFSIPFVLKCAANILKIGLQIHI